MDIEIIVWIIEGVMLAIGAIATSGILAVGHWFPWVRKLSRVQAYIYGVVSIWLGLVIWRVGVGVVMAAMGLSEWLVIWYQLVVPVGMGMISTVGGVVVIIAYRVDDWVLLARKARKAEEVDGSLVKR